jgi:hypothetical protein
MRNDDATGLPTGQEGGDQDFQLNGQTADLKIVESAGVAILQR